MVARATAPLQDVTFGLCSHLLPASPEHHLGPAAGACDGGNYRGRMASRLTLPALSFGTCSVFNCDSTSASSAQGPCFTHQRLAETPHPTALLCPAVPPLAGGGGDSGSLASRSHGEASPSPSPGLLPPPRPLCCGSAPPRALPCRLAGCGQAARDGAGSARLPADPVLPPAPHLS